jgi:Domain of unknown function (DUF4430)
VSPIVRIVLATLAVIGVAGCGLGPGRGTSDVSLTVTRSFGAGQVGAITVHQVPGAETVMRMLQRSFEVTTRYGGGFVESVNGHSGGSSHLDWFYYVNGVEATAGAAGTSVHRGDRIWWDLHNWSATNSIPAVVGSYPEPFVHGVGGKRLPVTLECAAEVNAACDKAAAALTAAGVPLARQLIGTGSGPDTIGVVVGTWREVSGQVASALIARGPSASGVYARFSGLDGRALELLDPHGRPVRTLGAGAGLVAATGDHISEPTWLITGTDPAGVLAAAAALTPGRLRNHFALAVHRSSDVPVPVQGPAG